MPKRKDIKSILVVGAGPIVIGQACEFDYSGTQACKALKKEGYEIILINSNPATIMTDPDVADKTYIEPITAEILKKIIKKEKPDALLPTMGGQTALNVSLEVSESGFLKEYNVELIGADEEAISKAENRDKFRKAMSKIGLKTPKSFVSKSLDHAMSNLNEIGLPVIIRPSFTLGGTGGGIATNLDEFKKIASSGIESSPTNEILVEESVAGWKEYEMEVVRDKADNCIIICSIENIDPMGVHTGDSITVAPALTLTDKEYQNLRIASINILREIGVDTGGSNVQFAINPKNGDMVVIEMNPRVSRSSALASKATGFPIAKIAALLAVGYTLDELKNDITKTTPASFEPTIDYVVTKIPRFAFEKFPGSDPMLSSSMKSVGEAMAIGKNFKESFQKALRSLEIGLSGFDEFLISKDIDEIEENLRKTSPERILIIADAIRAGISLSRIHELTFYDPWFLNQINEIISTEKELQIKGMPEDRENILLLKTQGFSDKRLSKITNKEEKEIRLLRESLEVTPVYKRVDTCAAEFNSKTAYMYSTYGDAIFSSNIANEALPSSRDKVIILGGGPNRIGQGIEFDYCCVHGVIAAKECGYETIMINCNPETVSTDFDTADKLYFEPVFWEHIYDIILHENPVGVIVQLGGQTALKLAEKLARYNIPVLGTSYEALDLAEDRGSFSKLLKKEGIPYPKFGVVENADQAVDLCRTLGFPLLVRPSYVLGGQKMKIVINEEDLENHVIDILKHMPENQILLDHFLEGALECEADAICDGDEVRIIGIMQHIEPAGIHSGDSYALLPPFNLGDMVIEKIKDYTERIAVALKTRGLINVQFAVKDDEVYIIEANPRASRTVPFISKAYGVPYVNQATKVMLGEAKLKDLPHSPKLEGYAVKIPVFSYEKFPDVNKELGPEMKSTGEGIRFISDLRDPFFRKIYSERNLYLSK